MSTDAERRALERAAKDGDEEARIRLSKLDARVGAGKARREWVIVSKATGLQSAAGFPVKFGKKGRVFGRKGDLELHLGYVARHLGPGERNPYEDCEILEYEITQTLISVASAAAVIEQKRPT